MLIHSGDKLLFLATSCRKLNMLNFGNLSPGTSNLSPEQQYVVGDKLMELVDSEWRPLVIQVYSVRIAAQRAEHVTL